MDNVYFPSFLILLSTISSMTITLLTVPYEIHLETSRYLSAQEIINVSHTCAQLLPIYRPISWKNCMVVQDKRFLSDCYGKFPWHLRYRYITSKNFKAQRRCSWFDPTNILALAIDISLLSTDSNVESTHLDTTYPVYSEWLFDSEDETKEEDEDAWKNAAGQLRRKFLHSTFSRWAFPNLQIVRITRDWEYRESQAATWVLFPAETDHQSLPLESLVKLKHSLIYASLTTNSSYFLSGNFKKLAVEFQTQIILRTSREFFRYSQYFQDIKSLSLHLNYRNTESLAADISLPNLEYLSLACMQPDLLLYIVLQTHNWPKLKELETEHGALWTPSVVMLQSGIQHLRQLPTTLSSVHLILRKLKNFGNGYTPIMALRNDVFEDDLPSIVIPQVTHLTSTMGFLGRAEQATNILSLPGLKCMKIPAHVPWSPLMNTSLAVQNLALLELKTNYTKDENFTSSLFSILRYPETLKSLKHLRIVLNTNYPILPEMETANNVFFQVRNHYKETSQTPSVEWVKDALSGCCFFGNHRDSVHFNYAFRKMLLSLFIQPLKTVPLIRLCQLSPSVSESGWENHFYQACFLEAVGMQMLKVPSLEYLHIDFRGKGFVSPGLYRLLNFHPTLKQALVKVELTTFAALHAPSSYRPFDFSDVETDPEDSDLKREWWEGPGKDGEQETEDEEDEEGDDEDDDEDEEFLDDHKIRVLGENYTTLVFSPSFKNLSIAVYKAQMCRALGDEEISDDNYASDDEDIYKPAKNAIHAEILVQLAEKRGFSPDNITTFSEFPIPKRVQQAVQKANKSSLFDNPQASVYGNGAQFLHPENENGWF